LNGVTNAKIVLGNNQIVASHLVSNMSVVKCQIDLTNASAGSWDVIVTDAFGQQGKLVGALSVT